MAFNFGLEDIVNGTVYGIPEKELQPYIDYLQKEHDKKNNLGTNVDDLTEFLSDKLSCADVTASKNLAEISAKIVKKRLDLNMTQIEFAKLLSVSLETVCQWENTDYDFSIKQLSQIANVLGCDLEINFNVSMQQNKSK